MDLQKIVIVGVAIAALGGGVWYATQEKSSEPMNSVSSTDESSQEETKSLSGLGSLKEIMGLGEQVKCTFSTKDPSGVSSEGTMYYANDKFRVDSEVVDPHGTTIAHVINDGQKTYTWGTSPMGDMAIVFSNEDTDTSVDLDFSEGPDSRQYMDMGEEVEYDCDRWGTDPSVFTPPSNVSFTDMAAMMQEAFGKMPEGLDLPEGFEMPEGIPMAQ